MNVSIFNQRKNPHVSEYVRDRLEQAFGRFADRIGQLNVYLGDENGSKGGEDKVCSIDVKYSPRGNFCVKAKHGNIYAAIAKAVRRAGTVIQKKFDRRHVGLSNPRLLPEV